MTAILVEFGDSVWIFVLFFGHKDAEKELEPTLRLTLIDLIENKNVYNFYVGNNGNFDYMVKNTLKALKNEYKYINYAVVLTYMPSKKNEFDYTDYSDTIYLDELEKVPYKYRIYRRNIWMINKSNYVITYVKHNVGGASQFKNIAERKKKKIINLALVAKT